MTMITDMVKVGNYQGFIGTDAPSITVSNGENSVKFSILSSGKRFNITKFKKGKACGWMSMVDVLSANEKLNNLFNDGFEVVT